MGSTCPPASSVIGRPPRQEKPVSCAHPYPRGQHLTAGPGLRAWPPRSPSRGESAETVPGVRHLATSRAEIAEHLIDLVGGERGDIEGLVQAKRHQQEGHEDRVFDGRTITD